MAGKIIILFTSPRSRDYRAANRCALPIKPVGTYNTFCRSLIAFSRVPPTILLRVRRFVPAAVHARLLSSAALPRGRARWVRRRVVLAFVQGDFQLVLNTFYTIMLLSRSITGGIGTLVSTATNASILCYFPVHRYFALLRNNSGASRGIINFCFSNGNAIIFVFTQTSSVTVTCLVIPIRLDFLHRPSFLASFTR